MHENTSVVGFYTCESTYMCSFCCIHMKIFASVTTVITVRRHTCCDGSCIYCLYCTRMKTPASIKSLVTLPYTHTCVRYISYLYVKAFACIAFLIYTRRHVYMKLLHYPNEDMCIRSCCSRIKTLAFVSFVIQL